VEDDEEVNDGKEEDKDEKKHGTEDDSKNFG
jgi:hypothetical protein